MLRPGCSVERCLRSNGCVPVAIAWRALLLLARYGEQDRLSHVVPRISQETLAGDDRHDALAGELFLEQVQENSASSSTTGNSR
jgi:hypothetical protein